MRFIGKEVVLLGAGAQLVPYGLLHTARFAILTWPLWAAAFCPPKAFFLLLRLPSFRIKSRALPFWSADVMLVKSGVGRGGVFALLTWEKYISRSTVQLWVSLALSAFPEAHTMKSAHKLVFLNSFSLTDTPKQTCRAFFLFFLWWIISSCISRMASPQSCFAQYSFVDDGCTECTLCGMLASLWGGQGLALLETTQLKVCRKKRKNPPNKILTKDVNQEWKMQRRCKEHGHTLLRGVLLLNEEGFGSPVFVIWKWKSKNGNLLTLQNNQNWSDLTLNAVAPQEEEHPLLQPSHLECDLLCAQGKVYEAHLDSILHLSSQLHALRSNSPLPK